MFKTSPADRGRLARAESQCFGGAAREVRRHWIRSTQTIEGDRVFEIPTDEDEARFSAIRKFTDIEGELDRLTRYLPGYEGNMIDLAIELELFRTNVREEARKSARRSLYGIAFSGYLLNKFNNKLIRWLVADDDGRKRIIERRSRGEE
jgi:hypothetical protein